MAAPTPTHKRARIAGRFESGPGFVVRRMTDARRDLLIAALLDWSERWLRHRIGPVGEEWAGSALHQAIGAFDATRGVPLRPYLRQQLYWIARDHMRAAGEWREIGSSRTTISIDAAGEHAAGVALGVVGAQMQDTDDAVALLKRIDRLGGAAALVGLGKIMGPLDQGGFSDATIGRMLCVGPHTVKEQLGVVRRSLSDA